MNEKVVEMPDWDKINGRKRLEIIKGQTANQLIQVLTTELQAGKIAFRNFNEFLKTYEQSFPKLLEVNLRLLNQQGGE